MPLWKVSNNTSSRRWLPLPKLQNMSHIQIRAVSSGRHVNPPRLQCMLGRGDQTGGTANENGNATDVVTEQTMADSCSPTRCNVFRLNRSSDSKEQDQETSDSEGDHHVTDGYRQQQRIGTDNRQHFEKGDDTFTGSQQQNIGTSVAVQVQNNNMSFLRSPSLDENNRNTNYAFVQSHNEQRCWDQNGNKITDWKNTGPPKLRSPLQRCLVPCSQDKNTSTQSRTPVRPSQSCELRDGAGEQGSHLCGENVASYRCDSHIVNCRLCGVGCSVGQECELFTGVKLKDMTSNTPSRIVSLDNKITSLSSVKDATFTSTCGGSHDKRSVESRHFDEKEKLADRDKNQDVITDGDECMDQYSCSKVGDGKEKLADCDKNQDVNTDSDECMDQNSCSKVGDAHSYARQNCGFKTISVGLNPDDDRSEIVDGHRTEGLTHTMEMTKTFNKESRTKTQCSNVVPSRSPDCSDKGENVQEKVDSNSKYCDHGNENVYHHGNDVADAGPRNGVAQDHSNPKNCDHGNEDVDHHGNEIADAGQRNGVAQDHSNPKNCVHGNEDVDHHGNDIADAGQRKGVAQDHSNLKNCVHGNEYVDHHGNDIADAGQRNGVAQDHRNPKNCVHGNEDVDHHGNDIADAGQRNGVAQDHSNPKYCVHGNEDVDHHGNDIADAGQRNGVAQDHSNPKNCVHSNEDVDHHGNDIADAGPRNGVAQDHSNPKNCVHGNEDVDHHGNDIADAGQRNGVAQDHSNPKNCDHGNEDVDHHGNEDVYHHGNEIADARQRNGDAQDPPLYVMIPIISLESDAGLQLKGSALQLQNSLLSSPSLDRKATEAFMLPRLVVDEHSHKYEVKVFDITSTPHLIMVAVPIMPSMSCSGSDSLKDVTSNNKTQKFDKTCGSVLMKDSSPSRISGEENLVVPGVRKTANDVKLDGPSAASSSLAVLGQKSEQTRTLVSERRRAEGEGIQVFKCVTVDQPCNMDLTKLPLGAKTYTSLLNNCRRQVQLEEPNDVLCGNSSIDSLENCCDPSLKLLKTGVCLGALQCGSDSKRHIHVANCENNPDGHTLHVQMEERSNHTFESPKTTVTENVSTKTASTVFPRSSVTNPGSLGQFVASNTPKSRGGAESRPSIDTHNVSEGSVVTTATTTNLSTFRIGDSDTDHSPVSDKHIVTQGRTPVSGVLGPCVQMTSPTVSNDSSNQTSEGNVNVPLKTDGQGLPLLVRSRSLDHSCGSVKKESVSLNKRLDLDASKTNDCTELGNISRETPEGNEEPMQASEETNTGQNIICWKNGKKTGLSQSGQCEKKTQDEKTTQCGVNNFTRRRENVERSSTITMYSTIGQGISMKAVHLSTSRTPSPDQAICASDSNSYLTPPVPKTLEADVSVLCNICLRHLPCRCENMAIEELCDRCGQLNGGQRPCRHCLELEQVLQLDVQVTSSNASNQKRVFMDTETLGISETGVNKQLGMDTQVPQVSSTNEGQLTSNEDVLHHQSLSCASAPSGRKDKHPVIFMKAVNCMAIKTIKIPYRVRELLRDFEKKVDRVQAHSNLSSCRNSSPDQPSDKTARSTFTKQQSRSLPQSKNMCRYKQTDDKSVSTKTSLVPSQVRISSLDVSRNSPEATVALHAKSLSRDENGNSLGTELIVQSKLRLSQNKVLDSNGNLCTRQHVRNENKNRNGQQIHHERCEIGYQIQGGLGQKDHQVCDELGQKSKKILDGQNQEGTQICQKAEQNQEVEESHTELYEIQEKQSLENNKKHKASCCDSEDGLQSKSTRSTFTTTENCLRKSMPVNTQPYEDKEPFSTNHPVKVSWDMSTVLSLGSQERTMSRMNICKKLSRDKHPLPNPDINKNAIPKTNGSRKLKMDSHVLRSPDMERKHIQEMNKSRQLKACNGHTHPRLASEADINPGSYSKIVDDKYNLPSPDENTHPGSYRKIVDDKYDLPSPDANTNPGSYSKTVDDKYDLPSPDENTNPGSYSKIVDDKYNLPSPDANTNPESYSKTVDDKYDLPSPDANTNPGSYSKTVDDKYDLPSPDENTNPGSCSKIEDDKFDLPSPDIEKNTTCNRNLEKDRYALLSPDCEENATPVSNSNPLHSQDRYALLSPDVNEVNTPGSSESRKLVDRYALLSPDLNEVNTPGSSESRKLVDRYALLSSDSGENSTTDTDESRRFGQRKLQQQGKCQDINEVNSTPGSSESRKLVDKYALLSPDSGENITTVINRRFGQRKVQQQGRGVTQVLAAPPKKQFSTGKTVNISRKSCHGKLSALGWCSEKTSDRAKSNITTNARHCKDSGTVKKAKWHDGQTPNEEPRALGFSDKSPIMLSTFMCDEGVLRGVFCSLLNTNAQMVDRSVGGALGEMGSCRPRLNVSSDGPAGQKTEISTEGQPWELDATDAGQSSAESQQFPDLGSSNVGEEPQMPKAVITDHGDDRQMDTVLTASNDSQQGSSKSTESPTLPAENQTSLPVKNSFVAVHSDPLIRKRKYNLERTLTNETLEKVARVTESGRKEVEIAVEDDQVPALSISWLPCNKKSTVDHHTHYCKTLINHDQRTLLSELHLFSYLDDVFSTRPDTAWMKFGDRAPCFHKMAPNSSFLGLVIVWPQEVITDILKNKLRPALVLKLQKRIMEKRGKHLARFWEDARCTMAGEQCRVSMRKQHSGRSTKMQKSKSGLINLVQKRIRKKEDQKQKYRMFRLTPNVREYQSSADLEKDLHGVCTGHVTDRFSKKSILKLRVGSKLIQAKHSVPLPQETVAMDTKDNGGSQSHTKVARIPSNTTADYLRISYCPTAKEDVTNGNVQPGNMLLNSNVDVAATISNILGDDTPRVTIQEDSPIQQNVVCGYSGAKTNSRQRNDVSVTRQLEGLGQSVASATNCVDQNKLVTEEHQDMVDNRWGTSEVCPSLQKTQSDGNFPTVHTSPPKIATVESSRLVTPFNATLQEMEISALWEKMFDAVMHDSQTSDINTEFCGGNEETSTHQTVTDSLSSVLAGNRSGKEMHEDCLGINWGAMLSHRTDASQSQMNNFATGPIVPAVNDLVARETCGQSQPGNIGNSVGIGASQLRNMVHAECQFRAQTSRSRPGSLGGAVGRPHSDGCGTVGSEPPMQLDKTCAGIVCEFSDISDADEDCFVIEVSSSSSFDIADKEYIEGLEQQSGSSYSFDLENSSSA